jgi:hypothetical protein
LGSGISEDEIPLLIGIYWRCIAMLIEWIEEDLGGFLKRDAVFFDIPLRLLIIPLELDALEPIDHIHTFPL